MVDRADPVYPAIWTAGPGRSATVPVEPARTAPGDFVAAVGTLLARYGTMPTELRVRDAGAASWRSVPVASTAETMGGCRSDVRVDDVRGPAVEVAADDAVTFRFEPADDAWTTTVRTAEAPDDEEAPARIAGHVNAFLAAPDAALVNDIDHRTDAERDLVEAVNRTAQPVVAPFLLHRRIEQVVDAMPDELALVQGDLTLTYAELDGRANALAERITAAGVGPGDRVGVAAARGATLAVGIYAALKAGAAFVPLDPLLPPARQQALRRLGRVALVVAEAGQDVTADGSAPVLTLDPVERMPSASRPAPVPVDGADLAYAIFTSGTTGEPNAALLDHAGRVNSLDDLNQRIGLGPGDRVLAVSSPSFDMSIQDTVGTLMTGAAIVFPERGRENDVGHWADLAERQRATVLQCVPTALTLFLTAWGTGRQGALRIFLVGGDWLPLTQPDAARRAFPGARFISMGGATEVSVYSTTYEVGTVDPAWRSIPYGRPMVNQTAYVLDSAGRPAAVDQVGELYFGGIGVGWGYQDRPSLTAAKFLPDPFRAEPDARMYRTGDLARLRADGELELIGRVDQQVKIGGLRVEPGEIEARLREHAGVREAVVVPLRDDVGRARSLAAFLVPVEPDVEPEALIRDARRHLSSCLPAAMVPARMEVRAELPVNANGKVARRQLAESAARQGPAPQVDDELLAVVGNAWREVLGLPALPATDDSFVALGGSSLAAMQVVSRLNRQLVADIKVADLLAADTVARVANVVAAHQGRAARPPVKRRATG
ncbi:amino acid adenylation domain-containing protein [Micromonospora sp. NPDC051543]|uniref:amino acid adenylation domain-containing protein n=1 Tax=Micromonospora sp. NPDC051543 TaxID=3364287 RepID=UPI0037986427